MMESNDNITEKNKCNSFVQNCTEINEEYEIEIKEETLDQELECEAQIQQNNEEKTKIKLEENDADMQPAKFQEVTIKEEFNQETDLQGDTLSQNNTHSGNILQNLLTQTQPQEKLEVNNDQNNPNAMHYYIIFYPNPTPNLQPIVTPPVPPDVIKNPQNINQNPENIHEHRKGKQKYIKDMHTKIDFHQKHAGVDKEMNDVLQNPKDMHQEVDPLERPEEILDIDYTPKDIDQTKLEKSTVFHQEFENFLKTPGYIHKEVLKPTEIDLDPLSLPTEIEDTNIRKKSVEGKNNYVKRIVIRRQNIERGPLFHKKIRSDPLSLQKNGAGPLLLNQQIDRDPLSLCPEIEPRINIIEKPSAMPQETERDPLSIEPADVYPIDLRRRSQGDFVCDICNKSFPFPSSLATHKVKHTNEKPYKCSVCGKSYKQAQSLDRHRVLHGNAHNYVKKESLRCHVCWRVFPSVPIINAHKCIQRFKCIACDKVFNYKGKFDLHICKNKHTGEKTFKCEVCAKEFHKKMYLDAHKLTHETQIVIS